MDESDFEGTIILEKLAQIGEVDAFFEAVDADDFEGARFLMQRAHLDAETIAWVLEKMREADASH